MAPFIPHQIYNVSAKKDEVINDDNDVDNDFIVCGASELFQWLNSKPHGYCLTS